LGELVDIGGQSDVGALLGGPCVEIQDLGLSEDGVELYVGLFYRGVAETDLRLAGRPDLADLELRPGRRR